VCWIDKSGTDRIFRAQHAGIQHYVFNSTFGTITVLEHCFFALGKYATQRHIGFFKDIKFHRRRGQDGRTTPTKATRYKHDATRITKQPTPAQRQTRLAPSRGDDTLSYWAASRPKKGTPGSQLQLHAGTSQRTAHPKVPRNGE
jgi:hypothetical protein